MNKSQDNWSIKDDYEGITQMLLVNFGVNTGHNVKDGKLITEEELNGLDIEVGDLCDYNTGDRFFHFEAYIDPNQQESIIQKKPKMWVHDLEWPTHLILTHPKTNNSKKKVKKTQKNISDAKKK